MAKPRTLYYSILKYQPENRAMLDELFDVVELRDPRDDTDVILAEVEVAFAPLGFVMDRAKMERCKKLKVIASNTTGVGHIDVREAARRELTVCALHDEQSFLQAITPTAELTIGLMLAAWRRIPACHKAASEGRWDRRPWGAPRMFSRMRLGIVGYGRLGRKVAAIARAMEMDVDYYDPYQPDGTGTLIELAKKSDILSLHQAANEETRNQVNREVMEAMPQGAMVVNTARGEVMDLDALLDLLESGRLRCAALDVMAGEYDPDFNDHFHASRAARYAREHDNLILTPHISGSTYDAWGETERFTIEKAARALGMTIGGVSGTGFHIMCHNSKT